MFSKYKPTWMVESIYQITPHQLKKYGIKAVLTDLDNTLIAWNNPDGTKELRNWLVTMKQADIPVIVVSNNKAPRVARAVASFDLPFISRAMKPFGYGIKKALATLDLLPEEVVMVGDQLMTDIRAAHAAKVRSVLVRPIVQTDAWNTRINRWREKIVMRHLLKNNPEMKWRGELV
ncbi:YqeG family HAD IIIA-type phosphatase [Enterococcus columbae]|uniref:HAD phosphatase, family IIIA n=1 Tax=Enterococcus columbae DSM 7374 = ATCC 51263 TaxID=1121865 RepID=S0KDZ5_9ENTE|nr:YqeG family HAD IIIA-type phosphatase [Enterococcus columbae]EOT42882.1 HAD phosphatase, family IIIA [Enterococcus columbae DSM 7374 = ATCC 51263]EOW87681.1 HAD phosphatase, family IIIA [Enterococcus columbae DSM 7374 = ATCC 51263]OJG24660.1 HAD phosphatase, family IIIA [Enterococcus columbae DSM 7374 = ATCC 51263]